MKHFAFVFTLLSIVAITLMSLMGCGKKEAPIDQRVQALESKPKYKCIEGVLYERMGGDIWLSKNTKCVVSP